MMIQIADINIWYIRNEHTKCIMKQIPIKYELYIFKVERRINLGINLSFTL